MVACALLLPLVLLSTLLWRGSSTLVTTDSASYLSSASNLDAGKGLTTSFAAETTRLSPSAQVGFGDRVPLEYFGPVYPTSIAVVARVDGSSVAGAARIVNLIALVMTFAATAMIVLTLAGPHLSLLVVSELLVLFGPVRHGLPIPGTVVGLTGIVLSEVLFIPWALTALWVCAYAGRERRRVTAALVGCVVVTALTRYEGIAIGVAAGLAMLMADRRQWRRAVIVAASAPLGLVAWQLLAAQLWGAGTGTALAWHPASVNLRGVVDVVSSWFHLASIPFALRTAFVVLVGLGPVVVVAVPAVQRLVFGRALGREPKDLLVRALALAGPSLVAAIAGTQLLFVDTVTSNQRILSPAQPVLYLALVAIGALSLQRRRADRRVIVAAGSALIAVALAAAIPSITHLRVDNTYIKYIAAVQKAGERTSPYRALPAHTVLFTNQPSGVWLKARRVAYMIPFPVTVTTHQKNRNYQRDVKALGEIVQARHGLVTIEPSVLPNQGSLTEFARIAGLHVGAACDNGTKVLVPATAAPSLRGC